MQLLPTISFAVFRKLVVAPMQLRPYLRAMTAAEEVNAIIERTGWSKYELAKRSGLPRSTIKRICDGKAAVLSTTMDKIREAAKVRKRGK